MKLSEFERGRMIGQREVEKMGIGLVEMYSRYFEIGKTGRQSKNNFALEVLVLKHYRS